jgi:prepilin-type N-terminal cleavage/methylation domain-containing protein/prepilin-type processing-associated H-X9-DG protein
MNLETNSTRKQTAPNQEPLNRMQLPRTCHKGFTLTELLVVIAIIAVLTTLLLPGHAKSREQAQALTCMGNNKQLVLGMMMYANDSQGLLPPNGDDDLDGVYWINGNMQVVPDSWDRRNLTNSAYNKLARYTGSNTDIYRCPADQTTVSVAGVVYPRIRSYSLSCAVGTVGGSDFWPNGIPVAAPALMGYSVLNTPNDQMFNTFGKLADNYAPGPANVITFVDEDEYSINFGSFNICMKTGPTLMFDWPATRHGGVASLSFLDGHAELHQWLDGRTKNTGHRPGVQLGYSGGGTSTTPTAQGAPDNPDILWLQSHTTTLK